MDLGKRMARALERVERGAAPVRWDDPPEEREPLFPHDTSAQVEDPGIFSEGRYTVGALAPGCSWWGHGYTGRRRIRAGIRESSEDPTESSEPVLRAGDWPAGDWYIQLPPLPDSYSPAGHFGPFASFTEALRAWQSEESRRAWFAAPPDSLARFAYDLEAGTVRFPPGAYGTDSYRLRRRRPVLRHTACPRPRGWGPQEAVAQCKFCRTYPEGMVIPRHFKIR